MRTKTGRRIGSTYRYFSNIHRRKSEVILAFYGFLAFVFVSTAGKSIGFPLMVFFTILMLMSFSVIILDVNTRDSRHLKRYIVKKESIDDYGNSKIFVEWYKDHSHDWIPNKPYGLQRLRFIGE